MPASPLDALCNGRRRNANRESARRVRQKRQEALFGMQERLEATQRQVASLAARLSQSEAQRAVLTQQGLRMGAELTEARARCKSADAKPGNVEPSQVPAKRPSACSPPHCL